MMMLWWPWWWCRLLPWWWCCDDRGDDAGDYDCRRSFNNNEEWHVEKTSTLLIDNLMKEWESDRSWRGGGGRGGRRGRRKREELKAWRDRTKPPKMRKWGLFICKYFTSPITWPGSDLTCHVRTTWMSHDKENANESFSRTKFSFCRAPANFFKMAPRDQMEGHISCFSLKHNSPLNHVRENGENVDAHIWRFCWSYLDSCKTLCPTQRGCSPPLCVGAPCSRWRSSHLSVFTTSYPRPLFGVPANDFYSLMKVIDGA